MSTIATRWSRSRCNSVTRARRRGSSSPLGGVSSVAGGVVGAGGSVCSFVLGLVRVELVAVESDHAVATHLLGHVECVVGRAHERLAVLDLRVRPPRHTEARRALEGAAVEG